MRNFVVTLLIIFSIGLNAQSIIYRNIIIDDICYNLYDDNTGEVSVNFNKCFEGDMVIPETIEYDGETYTVTRIGYCRADYITNVYIPKTVTSINKQSFEVYNVISEILSKEPECYLDNFYVAEDNPSFTSVDGVLYNKELTRIIKYPRGRKGAYRVLDGTKYSAERCFEQCINLTEITLPASYQGLKSDDGYNLVGEKIFNGCRKLENIYSDASFNGVYGYVSVNGVLYSYANTWYGWIMKETPDRVEEFNNFVGSDIWYVWELDQYPPGRKNETYKIEDAPEGYNVVSIGSLNGCSYLREIQMPDMPTVIGQLAFAECMSLEKIDLSKVMHIDSGAFSDCIGLKLINLSNPLIEELPIGVFSGCKSLEEIEFPENLRIINNHALSECSSLKSFILPKSVTHCGAEIVKGCSALSSLAVDKDNPIYDSRENCNAIIETATNKMIVAMKNTFIPETVTSIGDFSFYNLAISQLTIPASVDSIGELGLFFHSPSPEIISLTCLRNTPPSLSNSYSLPFSHSCIIHVLPGCKAAYENAEIWKDYTIIDDAIANIRPVSFERETYIYDLTGKVGTQLQQVPHIIIKNGKKYMVTKK
ncbi:MAG: leucine-rich repeat domain-containing protein [Bacteroidaceae bacterium]|nr:leucine-rich repeat domain-containing protein [Bacteroidaceae bacterium]